MATSFKLLRTDTANKRPSAAQLSIGELGLNYDATTPGLFFEDDAGGVRKIGPMEVSSSAPNSTAAGQTGNSTGELWLDNSSAHILKYYTGTGWQDITLAGISIDGSENVTLAANLTWSPSSSVTPGSNGQLTVEATNDTTLTFKLKGSDGTVRSGTITLS